MKPWRAVDAEVVLATRKLVDSVREQEILERLIEESERAARSLEEERDDLHPLLTTPFRLPPLAHGSRFSARHEFVRAGRYRVRVTLSKADDVIVRQTLQIQVRPGVADPSGVY